MAPKFDWLALGRDGSKKPCELACLRGLKSLFDDFCCRRKGELPRAAVAAPI